VRRNLRISAVTVKRLYKWGFSGFHRRRKNECVTFNPPTLIFKGIGPLAFNFGWIASTTATVTKRVVSFILALDADEMPNSVSG
jgi:hypothetical protein